MDPRLEDLQRRIDASVKRLGVRANFERAVEETSRVDAFLNRGRLAAQAKASEELRQARLLATCIADEFERRGLLLDARPAH